KEILVDTLPADLDSLESWLRQLRGSRVTVRVPERGEKKAVLETVTKNAKEALVQHKLKRSSDLTTRSQALKEIQEHLGLPEAPLRIECIDISHTQGSNVVASLVVFEDGMAKKRDYRHLAIHGAAAADDTAPMYDVVSRRFSRYLEQTGRDQPHEPCLPPPNLRGVGA